jgi:hypothetical protein
MFKYFLFILISVNPVFAQSEAEKEVIACIDTLFMSIAKGDSSMAAAVLHPDCVLNSISIKNENSTLKSDKVSDFLKSIATPRQGLKLEEKVLSYSVQIDHSLATAWVPYQFMVNDKVNHYGTNAFTLVNTNSTWKIISIIDTRKK